jgi:hypothetical protein
MPPHPSCSVGTLASLQRVWLPEPPGGGHFGVSGRHRPLFLGRSQLKQAPRFLALAATGGQQPSLLMAPSGIVVLQNVMLGSFAPVRSELVRLASVSSHRPVHVSAPVHHTSEYPPLLGVRHPRQSQKIRRRSTVHHQGKSRES